MRLLLALLVAGAARAAEPAPAVIPAPVPIGDVDAVPNSLDKIDPDAYALVIGVEHYRQRDVPHADFAVHDAQTMNSYLLAAMGYDPANVVMLVDGQATLKDFQKNLERLRAKVTAASRVFVYFAGHGATGAMTGRSYLMPQEADPNNVEDTSLPLEELYDALGRLPTKNVTVVLDACFSGAGGRSLLPKGTKPAVVTVSEKIPPNTVVLAAAGADQASESDPATHHGLLTYYLLAGLKGAADAKRDGKITTEELFAYLRPEVEKAAKRLDAEQTPSLTSPPDAGSRPWITLAPKK